MTPQAMQAVQQSWTRVQPMGAGAAELFYERLFEIAPRLQHHFAGSDMRRQHVALMEALTFAVSSLEEPHRLVPLLEDLGRRHHGYGVCRQDYQDVGAALLWTLERGLGARWTPALRQAWVEVYGLVSRTMIRAADALEAAGGEAKGTAA